MKKIILFSILLISIVSCSKSPKEKLIGNWNFVYSINNRKQYTDFEYHAFRSSIMFSKENFLFIDGGTLNVFNLTQFFTDTIEKSYTNVYYGDWFWNNNDSTITLNIKNREQKVPLILTVKSVNEKNIRFTINAVEDDFNDYNTYGYKRSYYNTSFSESDFMSLAFNSWRIPSDRKETETMIANYCRCVNF